YNNVLVIANTAPLNSFSGCVGFGGGNCSTFSYASNANTYNYNRQSGALTLTQSQFSADLSGPVTPANNQPGANGDFLGSISYNAPSTATPNTTSTFNFGADVPAAPTGVTATTCDPNSDAAAA